MHQTAALLSLLHAMAQATAVAGHELRISEGRCGAYLGQNPFTWRNVEDRKRKALTAPEDVAHALARAPTSLHLGNYAEEITDIVEEYSSRCYGPYWSLELGGALCQAGTASAWDRVCATSRRPEAAAAVLAVERGAAMSDRPFAEVVADATIACTCSTYAQLRDACDHSVAPFGEDSPFCLAVEDDGCLRFHAFGGLCELSEVVAERRPAGASHSLRALQRRFSEERAKNDERERLRGAKKLLWGSWADLRNDMRQGASNRFHHPPTRTEVHHEEVTTQRRTGRTTLSADTPQPARVKVAMLLTAAQRASGSVHWDSVVNPPGPHHGSAEEEARRHGPRPFMLCAAGTELALVAAMAKQLRNAHVHAITDADEAAVLCTMLGFARCPSAGAARSCTGLLVREDTATVLLTDPCGVAEAARYDSMTLQVTRRAGQQNGQAVHGPRERWGERVPEDAGRLRMSPKFARSACNRHRHRALFHSAGGMLVLTMPPGEESEREKKQAKEALARACAALTHHALPAGYRGGLAPSSCA